MTLAADPQAFGRVWRLMAARIEIRRGLMARGDGIG